MVVRVPAPSCRPLTSVPSLPHPALNFCSCPDLQLLLETERMEPAMFCAANWNRSRL